MRQEGDATESERMERWKTDKEKRLHLPQSVVHNPELLFYSLLKQLKSEPMHMQYIQEHNENNKTSHVHR